MGMIVVSIPDSTPTKNLHKMTEWCIDNVGKVREDWQWYNYPLEFHFADENDAIMFRLRWL